jgi:hypothetical protein
MDQAATAQPAPASLVDDVVEIFVAPKAVFERRREQKLAPPLLLLLGLALVLYYLFLPLHRSTMLAAVSEPEAAAFMEQWGTLMVVLGGLFVPIAMLAGITVTAALLWVYTRPGAVSPGFRPLMLIATYASFVSLLQPLTQGLLAFLQRDALTDPARQLSLSAIRFVPPDTAAPAVEALLRKIDLLELWPVVLVGVGLYALAGVPKRHAALAAAASWATVALAGMGFAAVRG